MFVFGRLEDGFDEEVELDVFDDEEVEDVRLLGIFV